MYTRSKMFQPAFDLILEILKLGSIASGSCDSVYGANSGRLFERCHFELHN